MYTPKEMSIGYFKRGFGKRNYSLKRWIWYNSSDEELRYIKSQLTKFEKFIAD